MQSIISGKGLPPLNANVGYVADMTLKSKPNTTKRNKKKDYSTCNCGFKIDYCPNCGFKINYCPMCGKELS